MKRKGPDTAATWWDTQGRRGKSWLRGATILLGALMVTGASAQPGGAPGKPEFAQKPGQAPVEKRVVKEITETGQGSFWVVLREQANLKPAGQMWDWQARGSFVHDGLKGVANRTQPGLRRLLHNRRATFKPVWIVNAIHVTGDQAILDEMALQPEVKEIIAARTYSIPKPMIGQPLPGVNGVEWSIDRVGAPQAWANYGTRGEGIVVCNIDTGAQFDHPALVRQYRGTLDAGGFDHNYNWYDPAMICGSPALGPCDNNGHGTHTMGIMVGDDGAGNQIGVAPGARWIAAKGCEDYGCSSYALTACAQWILAPTDLNGGNPRPDLRPNIVNNSWGGGQGDPWYQSLVQAWIAAGIWPSFSIGNSGEFGCWTANSPGDYPESYAAGAFDINNQIAWFSSRGPSYFTVDGVNLTKPNITAPGVDIRSSVAGNGYAWYSGTSMASPHVAGTVALLWSAAPALIGDIANTRALLDATAIDTDGPGCGGTPQNNNVWGEGRLDILAAVSQAPMGDIGGLRGTVSDSVTGLPIAGARVQISGPLSRTTLADVNGHYEFPVLSVGFYGLTATCFGYEGQAIGAVQVVKNQVAGQDVVLQRMPAFSVSGVVRDSRMEPVAGAAVIVLNTPIPPAITAADGSYGFALVPAGEYELQASGCGHCTDSAIRPLAISDHRAGFDFNLQLHVDAFGYWCRVVPPGYVEADTDIGLHGDDNSVQVGLPFPFTFYGQTYTSAWVSCNGFLTFNGSDAGAYWNGWIPDPTTPNAAIYAFWRDMMVGPAHLGYDPAGSLRTLMAGKAPNRQFVIEWRNLRILGWMQAMDVEIILFEDGRILAQYRNVPEDENYRGLGATIGLEDGEGTTGLLFSYAERAISSSQLSILYELPPSGFLQGQVLDLADSSPIAGALVTVSDESGLRRSLHTDASGVYRTQVPLGQYMVQASFGGFKAASGTVVVDAVNALFVKNFSLQAPGAAVNPGSLTFRVASGQRQSQNLTLSNTGSLELVWRISGGSPVSSGLPWVRAVPLSGTLPPGASQPIEITVDASTLDTGSQVAGLTIFNNSGRTPELAVPVTVLVTGSNLRGRVTDANNGRAIAGATVRVYKKDGALLRSLTTDLAGSYDTEVPLGILLIQAGAENYSTEAATLTVAANGRIFVQDFALRTAFLRGCVVDANDKRPIAGASVVVSGAEGSARTVKTDAAGAYLAQLPPGPYVLQASARRYSTESVAVLVAGQAEDRVPPGQGRKFPQKDRFAEWFTNGCNGTSLRVTALFGSQARVQDIALRTPLAIVSPAALALEVKEGKSKTRRLTLKNLGGLDLTWRVGGAAASQHPGGPGVETLVYRYDVGVWMTNNAGQTGLAYPAACQWKTAQASAALNVLIYADDYYHPAPYTFLDHALRRLGLPYTACYDGAWGGLETALTSGIWDLVLVGNDNFIPPSSTLDALNSYVLGGGRLVFHGWTIGGMSAGHPLWTTLGFTWRGDDWDPPSPVYWWQPAHPVFTDPQNVPEFIALTGSRYGVYGQNVEPLAGFDPLAGYTLPGVDPNQAALVIGNGGRTVFKGFLDGQNDADRDLDGVQDGIELWVNLISGIQSGFNRGPAWLTENPAAGTLTSNRPQEIQITVDAGALRPGSYSATLSIANNSGRSERLTVPVTVTVSPESP